MEVEGSFDNWTTRQTMQRSGKDFTIVKLLPPGVYQVTYCNTSCSGAWNLEAQPAFPSAFCVLQAKKTSRHGVGFWSTCRIEHS